MIETIIAILPNILFSISILLLCYNIFSLNKTINDQEKETLDLHERLLDLEIEKIITDQKIEGLQRIVKEYINK